MLLQGTQRILQEGPTLAIVMWMNRRHFVGLAASAVVAQGLPRAFAAAPVKPFALGVVIRPYGAPEERLRMAHDLGFPTVFLSMDDYLSKFTPDVAHQYRDLLAKYQLTATTVEVVGPPPLKWNFMQGPDTIGVVPPKTRAARIDALRQASDFAKLAGIPQVQTHCGFIPENPGDALYSQAVEAIRTVAKHCQGNGQDFLMETGQETPTTMSRAIHDVGLPNLGVGLDTANLLLYGKANPVADNGTAAGRQQNRRVNMVVSGDAIGVQTSEPQPQFGKRARQPRLSSWEKSARSLLTQLLSPARRHMRTWRIRVGWNAEDRNYPTDPRTPITRVSTMFSVSLGVRGRQIRPTPPTSWFRTCGVSSCVAGTMAVDKTQKPKSASSL